MSYFVKDGKVTQRIPNLPKIESLSAEDFTEDPEKVIRTLTAYQKLLLDLYTQAFPRFAIFEDLDVTTAGSADPIRIRHNFGCRVHWWVTSPQGSTRPSIEEDPSNVDPNELVLWSHAACTVSILIIPREV